MNEQGLKTGWGLKKLWFETVVKRLKVASHLKVASRLEQGAWMKQLQAAWTFV